MSDSRLITYRCENPHHLERQSPGVGKITVHERQWAYCGSEFEEGHDWKPTGGVPVERLFMVKASSDAARAFDPVRNGVATEPEPPPAPPKGTRGRATKTG